MGYAGKREDTSVRRARDDKPAVLIYEGASGARVRAAISLESSVSGQYETAAATSSLNSSNRSRGPTRTTEGIICHAESNRGRAQG